MSLDNSDKEINSKNDHKKELPIKFLFITYKKKKSVEQAIEKLNTWTQVTKSNFRELINSEQNGFRILKIKTWREMTKEYIKKRQQQIEKLKQNSQENIINYKEIEYKPGLIAEFRGVHPETNRHILKKLFDLVSPTSFIDYSPNQTYGYIRYKDADSAKIAENYFSRKKVIQVNGLDVSGTLFTTLKKKFEEDGDFQLIHDYEIIRLRILTDDEEKEYWDYINSSIKNRNKVMNYNKPKISIENNHTIFSNENTTEEKMDIDNETEDDSTEEKNQKDTKSSHIQFNPKPMNGPLNEIKHIRFDDSEDEENDNEDNGENVNEESKNEIENKTPSENYTINNINNQEDKENSNETDNTLSENNITTNNINKNYNNNNNNNNNQKETASTKKKRKRKYLKKHLKQKEKKMKLKAENEAEEMNMENE